MNYDLEQAAREAQCSPERLRKLAAAGEVPATKIGRKWLFSPALLQEWIDARCRSISDRAPDSGGSALAARLASQRAQRIASKRRSSSVSSRSDSGASRNSGT